MDQTVRGLFTWPMTRPTQPADASARAHAGAAMALAAMVCVQVGIALSVGLFDDVGPDGSAALRLAWAGVLLLVLVRPRPSAFSRRGFVASAVLGVVTAAMTLCFMAAVARLPLGTASALEFLGPLGVAIARGRGALKIWPATAAVGRGPPHGALARRRGRRRDRLRARRRRVLGGVHPAHAGGRRRGRRDPRASPSRCRSPASSLSSSLAPIPRWCSRPA